nr:A/G-specific adenine glycosylase [Methylobrevis albus]
MAPADRAAGVRPDPYRVWLSEIMLQQTTVAAVKSYFEAFTLRWPRLVDLAAATRDEVMSAWAGLGYYSRARNLKACAETVAQAHGGVFPASEAGLRALPGIGPYTAAAIAAIAFDEVATVVDGNVERVVSRLYRILTPLPLAKAEIRVLAERLTPAARPGDYAQAMMDLGATICTPKRPACSLCPVNTVCAAAAVGDPDGFPVKAPKAVRPIRHGHAFVAVREDGAVLLRRRADKGLLGGMAEVPGTDWTTERPAAPPPFAAAWRRLAVPVEHTFTHFHLVLHVWHAAVGGAAPAPDGHWWSEPDKLGSEALPSLMRKVVEAAVPGAGRRRP